MNTKKIVIITSVTAAVLVGFFLFYSETYPIANLFNMGRYHMGYGFGTGHMMGGGVMHFVFWIFMVLIFFSIFGSRKPAYSYNSGSAEELLKKRYVNGEINKEEYLCKMLDLKK